MPSGADIAPRVSPLTDEHREEVLTFLAERPLHTVVMAGFIRDNGVQSPLNRGAFHACRNTSGQLEGVALLGHATLFEARTEAAMKVFAELARRSQSAHVIMGEQDGVERFWGYYAEAGQTPRLLCRELLFEQRWPVGIFEGVAGLRRARLDDLEHVMPVQAQMAFEESGVNPLLLDAPGFRSRCARRIEQGRVWVWVERGRLLFKADVISDTPEANYIEGIYVHPAERGRGQGLRCISQLGRTLLTRTRALCLLVNERNERAQVFYRRAGYKFRGYYDTIYL
jgi:hypothetical protein